MDLLREFDAFIYLVTSKILPLLHRPDLSSIAQEFEIIA